MRLSIATAAAPAANPVATAAGTATEARPRRGRGRRLLAVLAAVVALSALLVGSFSAGALLYRDGTVSDLVIGVRSRSLTGYWLGFPFARESLPTVRIDMKFKDVQKIAAKRDAALRNRILISSDDDFVKAEWQFQGETIPVKMRLKGDWVDHLGGDKWSYRVQVRSDQAFLGMRNFSIQHPGTRNYLYEWAYLEHLRSEGILAPRYQFVYAVLNGRKLGTYAVEEHFSKELIESQRRREGVIIKYDEGPLWEQRVINSKRQGPYTDAFLANPDDALFDPNAATATVDTFRGKHLASSPELRAQRDKAIGLLRGYSEARLPAGEVFDPELMGRFLAVVELWSAEHQLDWHNLRFFYNPLTALLEPVGFDGEPPGEPSYTLLGPPWSFEPLRDARIAGVYVSELRRMTTADYLAGLRSRLEPRYLELRSTMYWEFGTLPEPWSVLAERQRLILGELAPRTEIAAYAGPVADGGRVLELRNLTALPVEVGDVRVNGRAVAAASLPVAGGPGANPPVVRDGRIILAPTRATRAAAAGELVALRLAEPAGGGDGAAPPPRIEVDHRIAGEESWRSAAAVSYAAALSERVLPRVTLEAAIAQHPFLRQDPAVAALVIAAGVWEVAGNLVIPDGLGLAIEAGTTLHFGSDSYLLATGPLTLPGSADRPIILAPTDAAGTWGGILLVRAGGESAWSHVEVARTSGVRIPGLGLTGGITFFESPLRARACHFHGSTAEDTLNVIRTRLDLEACELSDAASDAFDGDFVDARIADSSFHDIHGDAIDVSGSRIEIERVSVLRLGDKAISVGEASTAHVAGLHAEDVGIGMAAKDRSTVTAQDIVIRQARTAALAAYTKKKELGPARMQVTRLSVAATEQETIVDAGSTIDIEQRHIAGAPLDVKHLYAIGVLGN